MRSAIIVCVVFSVVGSADGKTNSVGMAMVKIPSGRFMMGSPCKQVARDCPKDDLFTSKDESEGCKASELVCEGDKDEQPSH